MTLAPTLTGKTTRLRPHVLGDMDPLWSFYQSPRAAYVTRPENRTDFWYKFTSEVGSWPLCGMGPWAIEVEDTLAGQISVCQPPHFAEPELGYILLDGFEGRGIAFEAANLALAYTRATIRPASLVRYIDERNSRSRALATRLGGILDPHAPKPDEEDVVYRYEVAP